MYFVRTGATALFAALVAVSLPGTTAQAQGGFFDTLLGGSNDARFDPLAQSRRTKRAPATPPATPLVAPARERRKSPLNTRRKVKRKSTTVALTKHKTRKPFELAPQYQKQTVDFPTDHKPGTVLIDTSERFLYYILEDGKAIRYGVGVGRQGFAWQGTAHIGRKRVNPAWHPPKAMRRRQPELPRMIAGGHPENPLGVRAMYLYKGDKDTLYRIHGTTAPRSIGRAMSSGCIRMLNAHVVDLYDRVEKGTQVVVY